ncbi:MAG TPA: RNA polymerase sigma factor [Candidatus Paceibacterota bacterium]|nr:RNA polymerase sigma factor [Candidatus Paceibacterota bacterium]
MNNTERKFTEACEEHFDALYRYCFFKTSSRDTAQDLVQETYLKAWNYLMKGEEIKNLKAFFYRILNNLIIDEYRKKKTVSLDLLSEKGFDPGVNETERMENQIDGERAMKLLKKIPEMYREVIFMRYVQELSLKEMADILDQSENAIAVKVHRGLKKVEKFFNNSRTK